MKKVIFSGMLGNALEWYDYALYAQFASIIAQQFFPSSDIKEILTYAVFAAGFFIRPIGGVVFGRIGDLLGRRAALVIGILTMSIPTAGIGLLPSYNSIGIVAPILLVIFRLIQGFSLGGEFSSCITYIVEHSPLKYRGLAGSASFVSMCLGLLLGSLTASMFYRYMIYDNLFNWGWRIPFIFGMVLGLIGFYIRIHLAESPIYKAAKANNQLSKRPLADTLSFYKSNLLIAIGIYLSVTGPFYTCTIFLENLMTQIGFSKSKASLSSCLMLITMIFTFPVSAYISDIIGRKKILLIGVIAIIILAYPLFLFLNSQNFSQTLTMQLIFAAIVGIYMGPIPTLLVESFPTKIRLTGVALSYNLSAAIFGGTTPMIGEILIRYTANPHALAYYLIALGIGSLIAIYHYRESSKKILFDEITQDN